MRTWEFILVIVVAIAGFVTVAVVMIRQNRELNTRRDTCAPFAVIGEVAHKGKRLAVCDSVDGPVVKEVR